MSELDQALSQYNKGTISTDSNSNELDKALSDYNNAQIDATSDNPELDKALRQYQGNQIKSAQPHPAMGVDADAFSSGVDRALHQFQASLAGSVETVSPKGSALESWAKGAVKQQQGLANLNGQSSVEHVSDIQWDSDKALQWGKNTIAGAVVNLPVPLAGAATGFLATGGNPLGAAGGLFLASLPQSVGEVENMMKDLAPDQDHPGVALAAGGAVASLNLLGVGKAITPYLAKEGAEALAKKAVASGMTKEAATNLIKQSTIAVAAAPVQAAIDYTASHEATDTDINGKELLQNMADAAVANAMILGTLGAGGKAVEKVRSSPYRANTGNKELIQGSALKKEEPVNSSEVGPVIPEKPQYTSEPITREAGPDTLPRMENVSVDKYLDMTQGRITDPVEPIAKLSLSGKEILDNIRRDRNSEGSVSEIVPIADREAILAAGWMDKLNPILRDKEHVETLIKPYLKGLDTETTRPLKELLGEIHSTAKTLGGLSIGEIKTYLPFVPDTVKILNDPEAFRQAMVDNSSDIDKAAVSKRVDSYLEMLQRSDPNPLGDKIDRVLRTSPSIEEAGKKVLAEDVEVKRQLRNGNPITPEYKHLEGNRVFSDVPQEVLMGFHRGGLEAVAGDLKEYVHRAAHRITMAESFGPRGHHLNSLILKAHYENLQGGRVDSSGNPLGLTTKEIDHIYNTYDAFNHQYGDGFKTKTEGAATGVLKTTAMTSVLALSTLNSLTDFLNLAVKGGITKTAVTMVPAIREFANSAVRLAFKDTPKSEVASMLAATGLTLDTGASAMLARMGDDSQTISFRNPLSKKTVNITPRAVQDAFFKVNFLTPWTQFTRTWAGSLAKVIMDEDLQVTRYADPSSRAYIAAKLRLADMGVNPDDFWRATSSEEQRRIQIRGMRSFVSDVVPEPGIADKPLWMSKKGYMSLLTMGRGYPTMFSNTILPALFNRFLPGGVGEAARARHTNSLHSMVAGSFLVGGFLTVGALQDALRQTVKQGTFDYQDDRSDEEYVFNILDKTLMPMSMSYLTSMYRAKAFGSSPIETVAGIVPTYTERLLEDGFNFMDAAVYDMTGIDRTKNGNPQSTIEALNKFLLDATPAGQFRKAIQE